MKKALFFIVIAVSLSGCGRHKQMAGTKLEPGTPVYEAAKQLATLYPFLNPDSNSAIIECRLFTITTGDVIDELFVLFPPILDRMQEAKNDYKAQMLIFSEAQRIAERRLLANAAKSEHISLNKNEIDSLVSHYKIIRVRQKDIKKYLAEKGKTINFIKKIATEEGLVKRYLKLKMKGRIHASEEEIRKQYESSEYLNLRHIFLATKNLSADEKGKKRNLMLHIKDLLKEGFSFSELAEKYSENAKSEHSGGLIKGVYHGQFSKKIDRVIFKLKQGEISEIIETPVGFHLFKVEKHVRESRPFREVYEVYRSQVEYQKMVKIQREILKTLRDRANCQVSKKWRGLE